MTYRIRNRDGDPRVEAHADGVWHGLPIDGRALAAGLEIDLLPNQVRLLSDREALEAIRDQLDLERDQFERLESQRSATRAQLQRHAVAILRRLWRGEAMAG